MVNMMVVKESGGNIENVRSINSRMPFYKMGSLSKKASWWKYVGAALTGWFVEGFFRWSLVIVKFQRQRRSLPCHPFFLGSCQSLTRLSTLILWRGSS